LAYYTDIYMYICIYVYKVWDKMSGTFFEVILFNIATTAQVLTSLLE